MADYTELNPGIGGDLIAADAIEGLKYQRVKLVHGANGTNAGDVSFHNGLPMKFSDEGNLDAFGRLRVSDPFTQFDWTNQYSPSTFANQLFWDVSTVNGSITPQANQASVRLSTGGTADDNEATVQTKQHIIYQPGKSRLVLMTFVMGAAVTNGIAEFGYGSAEDGIFLQRSGTAIRFVRRTKTSGTVADNVVEQADWNLDVMDGTGPSGFNLDFTKTQILFIDLEWLGVGRVRCGFVVDGHIVVAHEFLNANNLSIVYMRTGSLPLRASVSNDGTAGGTLTADFICASVNSEGGYETGNYPQFGASNASTARSTDSTLLPLLSIRAVSSFNANAFRGHLVPQGVGLLVASQIHEYRLIKNATLGGASWTAADSVYSAAQYDVTASSISGGVVLDCGYLAAAAQVRATGQADLFSRNPLVYTSLNNTQETLTLAVRTVTGSGSAYGNITWREAY